MSNPFANYLLHQCPKNVQKFVVHKSVNDYHTKKAEEDGEDWGYDSIDELSQDDVWNVLENEFNSITIATNQIVAKQKSSFRLS